MTNKRSCIGYERVFYFNRNKKLELFHINNKNTIPRNIANKQVIIFGNSQEFFFWYKYRRYSPNDMSTLPFTFGGNIYLTKTWSKLPIFMFALLCIYLIWYIFVVSVKIANILCYLILITTACKLKIKTINISDIYVIMMFICNNFIDYSISLSHI